MPIKFPHMHIAESALNRLMNAIEGETPFTLTSPQPAPVPPPDPSSLGVKIEDQTSTPTPDVMLPEEEDEIGVAESIATGGSPFEGMIGRQFGMM